MQAESPSAVMFMSADVSGSTDFKARAGQDASLWLEAFATLFRELPLIFIGQLAQSFMEEDDLPEAGVWKVLGDEVIFVALPQNVKQASLIAGAFVATVRDYDQRLSERWPLRIRGTCWAVELGGRNRMIEIPEMFGGSDGQPYRDFLGPDVDTGFRLSAHAGRGEVIISPNLAEAILAEGHHQGLDFDLFDQRPLKGVVGGQPFPLIMLRLAESSEHAGQSGGELLAKLQAQRHELRSKHGFDMAAPLFSG